MMPAAFAHCRVILILLLMMAPLDFVRAQQTMQLADSGDARDLYQQAENLLADGETSNAYSLLRAYEMGLVDDPYFHYLLGVAALDLGLNTEAISNLRRAVNGAPQFSAARMELARALYDVGEYGEAKPLFTNLLSENPPAAVRSIIDGYLHAIATRPSSPPSRFLPYAELQSGHDSNANGGTADDQFLGFTLSPENLETNSVFIEAAAGFDWVLPRSTNLGWVLGARAGYRDNPDAEFVDTGIVSGLASVNWRSGAVFGRAGINGYGATRDGESNEAYGGVNITLGRTLSDRWDLSVAVQSGALSYEESIEVMDVTRTLYSLSGSYRFASRGLFTIEAIGGNDDERESNSPYGNSKAGGRMAITAPIGDYSYFFASLGSLRSDYDGLFFGAAREDTQTTSLLQLEFRNVWTSGLTLAPRVRFINNESDVSLYDYDRTEVGLLIRWAPQ